MPRGTKKRMTVPVRAIDVFRLLGVGVIASDESFVKELNAAFDTLIRRIHQTPRLTDPEREDFLSYSKPHKKNDGKTTLRSMSEEELCSLPGGFMAKDYTETIGKVLDYQVPLEAKTGSGEGVVDLISEKGNTIYVIEVKSWENNEHPLRALFEALTFWLELLDKGALKRNQDKSGNAELFVRKYNDSNRDQRQFTLGDGKENFESKACLVPAILLYADSPICQKLCKKPERSCYSALYKKILKYVQCFSYRTGDKGTSLQIKKLELPWLKRAKR